MDSTRPQQTKPISSARELAMRRKVIDDNIQQAENQLQKFLVTKDLQVHQYLAQNQIPITTFKKTKDSKQVDKKSEGDHTPPIYSDSPQSLRNES